MGKGRVPLVQEGAGHRGAIEGEEGRDLGKE